MQTKFIITVLSALALSACGHGSSSGASQKNSSGSDDSLTQQKKIGESHSTKIAATIPLAALIVDVANEHDKRISSQSQDWDIAIRAAIHPCVGWEVDPMDRSKSNSRMLDGYLMANEGKAIGGNEAMTQIAAGVETDGVYHDQEAVKTKIIQVINALHGSFLADGMKRAQKIGPATVDLTGSGAEKPVHFQTAQDDFACGPSGVVWIHDGIKWFGQGSINGKEVSVAVESTDSTSAEQSSSNGTSTKDDNSQDSDVKAPPVQ
ncbi:hypothetical protein [Ferrovum sp.]|uniref:hypothetical protein n=1 Tax=Ferrovum sp. TaxID=2609467 RepID=UPI002637B964|nr:hypothetical protein [Ferrovum sp.]